MNEFSSPHANKGKGSEDEVRKWLEKMSTAHRGFAYHRLPDARTARGPLGNQPADFIVAIEWVQPHAFFLEVKETANSSRIPLSQIKQYGKLKMFWWAGMPPIVLVNRYKLGLWSFLTASQLFPEGDAPKSFALDRLVGYASAASALQIAFKVNY